jgi:xylulokinase
MERGAPRQIRSHHGKGYALYLKAVEAIAPEVKPSEVISIGGGARSPVFKQIKADILGLPYRGLDREEFGTLGAALVAGHAVGFFPDIAAAARKFSKAEGEPIRPDPVRHATYRRYVALYQELMDNSAVLFGTLAGIP